MRAAAITGEPGDVRARLADALETSSAFRGAVLVDPVPGRRDDLKAAFEGCDTVLHLPGPAWSPGSPEWTAQPEWTRVVLDAAGDVGVTTVVCLSSAVVYGAWTDNPLPLTEDAPLRPVPRLPAALALAEIERLLADWRANHPSASVAVLRAVTLVDEHARAALAPWTAATRVRGATPPVQFVHGDDVVQALELAATRRLEGAFNVAPDGWITGDQARQLAGGLLRPSLPEGAARLSWVIGARTGLSSVAPTFLPYVVHPWVVANDRLRAAGWTPQHTSEETFVAGHRLPRWREVLGRRRQEVALTALGGALAGIGVALARAVRRRSANAQVAGRSTSVKLRSMRRPFRR